MRLTCHSWNFTSFDIAVVRFHIQDLNSCLESCTLDQSPCHTILIQNKHLHIGYYVKVNGMFEVWYFLFWNSGILWCPILIKFYSRIFNGHMGYMAKIYALFPPAGKQEKQSSQANHPNETPKAASSNLKSCVEPQPSLHNRFGNCGNLHFSKKYFDNSAF